MGSKISRFSSQGHWTSSFLGNVNTLEGYISGTLLSVL